jgi:signal transduction histidine kinase
VVDVNGSAPLLGALVDIGHADSVPTALERGAVLAAELLGATASIARWGLHDTSPPTTAGAGVRTDARDSDILDGYATGEAAPRSVVDVSADPFLTQLQEAKVAVVGCPLSDPGFGALIAARPLDAGEFTDTDEQALAAIAAQTSLALGRLAFSAERRGLQEELRTSERLKTEFVAMTSHELRTPLTSIRAATSMVRSYWDTITDDRKHRLLEVIEGQAQRLSRLVENILAAANIEAGVVLPRITTVDLAAAADDVARDFAAEIDVTVDVERPLYAQADADHMRQILVNFVGNSLKYGDPPVAIVGRRVGDRIEMRVTDNGNGVPPDFVPRLFDRFTQASSGDSRHASGSGLGLSIVKGLAQASGGTVHYEPLEPQGSAFVLSLPGAP